MQCLVILVVAFALVPPIIVVGGCFVVGLWARLHVSPCCQQGSRSSKHLLFRSLNPCYLNRP